jgi:hypothetical protein
VYHCFMLISVKKHALVEDFVHNMNLDGHQMMDNYDGRMIQFFHLTMIITIMHRSSLCPLPLSRAIQLHFTLRHKLCAYLSFM